MLCIYIHIYIYICNMCASISLSLYVYIYIYIYTHIYIYICNMCASISLSLYVYIYIYICEECAPVRRPGHCPVRGFASARKETVRFDSFRFRNFRKLIGSVRFGSVQKHISSGSTRFGLRFLDMAWLGPVRFGSFPRPVPAGSRINGSVRFGSAGSVRFLILSCSCFLESGIHHAPRATRTRTYGRLADVQFATVQIEGLKPHIQIHSKCIVTDILSQEMYACNN